MSRLKDRLLNYHIQVKKFADDDQMILANDVLSMIEQLYARSRNLSPQVIISELNLSEKIGQAVNSIEE